MRAAIGSSFAALADAAFFLANAEMIL